MCRSCTVLGSRRIVIARGQVCRSCGGPRVACHRGPVLSCFLFLFEIRRVSHQCENPVAVVERPQSIVEWRWSDTIRGLVVAAAPPWCPAAPDLGDPALLFCPAISLLLRTRFLNDPNRHIYLLCDAPLCATANLLPPSDTRPKEIRAVKGI